MASVPVSVVVITRNEEHNICDCLDSVKGWADEIVIVDDNSTDRTRELAQRYTDKIFIRKMDVEGTHRNWAYDQATHDWVFSLDADERFTPELRDEIDRVLSDPECEQYNVFTIPRRNYIGDYWVKHGGQYPAAQLKLFSKSKSQFRFEEVEVHPRAFFQKPWLQLKSDLIHYSYRDFAHFLQKLNGQTTLEAIKWVKTNAKMSRGRALRRTGDRFFRTYFRKKSRKDGFYGFMVGYFASLYQIISYAKYWERMNDNIITDGKFPIPESALRYNGDKAPLTVIILTKNEEQNIEECLRSVKGWADEILIIDDESTDKTVEIASQYADKVLVRKMDMEGLHRNWAMKQAKNDWIFFLDADEVVTEEIKDEIIQQLAVGKNDSFSVPLKTYIGKYWVKHSGWYPANKLRIMDRRKQWYKEEEVHPVPANFVTCGLLTKDVIHKGYPDFAHFVASLNRQTTLEAQKWHRTGRKYTKGRAIWRTIDRFPRVFLGKRAYKDGFVGFMVAYFASMYQIMSYAKYWEIQQKEKRL